MCRRFSAAPGGWLLVLRRLVSSGRCWPSGRLTVAAGWAPRRRALLAVVRASINEGETGMSGWCCPRACGLAG